MPTVELVYDEGCPNAGEARAQLLRAFSESKVEPRWQEWRGDDAASPQHVRGHGSPTILVDGKDVVSSVDPGGGQSCRIYAGEDGSLRGVPDVNAIAHALREATASGGSPRSGGWKINLAMLPGIGAAFLPKVACPACWPAYAGFLTSVGFGFLLETTYLFPLTAAFLAIAVGALAYRAKRRRGYLPLLAGIAAAVTVLAGKFGFESDSSMYAGLAILIAASIWNTWPRRREALTCTACPGGEQPTNP
ncbi:MAG TPA: MerC family mercury resistance protein [Thermoanaerobaculia bacterium]|nr:MerC family mercury resistance protein [Thermoanaerobaculia bacterium]